MPRSDVPAMFLSSASKRPLMRPARPLRPEVLLAALLAATALAGCSDGDGGPLLADPVLREHAIPPTYLPGDFQLASGETPGLLAPYGMTANPGFANVSLFQGGGETPRLAWGAVYHRADHADEAVASFALEFGTAGAVARWRTDEARLSNETHLVVRDGRYATLVLPVQNGDLAAADEAAENLAAFLQGAVECLPGTWPPGDGAGRDPGSRDPKPRNGETVSGRFAHRGGLGWISVTATEPSFLTVDAAAEGADVQVDVFDSDGSAVASGVPFLQEIPGSRAQALVEAGSYAVRVALQAPCTAGPAYNVTAWAVATAPDGNGVPASATNLTVGAQGPFTLYPGTEEDWYRFDLTARSRVSIAVQEARGELGGATRTWLYDGQFRPLYVLDNPAPGSDEGRTVHDLDAGPYFVRIIALSEQVIFQYRMSFGAEPLA